jgi:nucleoid-associated protein EbfC
MFEVDPDYFSPERSQERLDLQEQQHHHLQELHRTLRERSFVGTAADGMVAATVQAGGGVTAIEIDPYLVQRYGVEGLGDVVMKAINDGMRQSAELTRELFGERAPALPGEASR